MTAFAFVVTVECETLSQAHQVMAERIGPDEDYGFDYRIGWNAPSTADVEEWDAEAVANEAWSQPSPTDGAHPADDPRHLTSDRF